MWITSVFPVDGVLCGVDKPCCAGERRTLVFGVIHNGYPQRCLRYPQGCVWVMTGDNDMLPVTRLFHFSYFQYFSC